MVTGTYSSVFRRILSVTLLWLTGLIAAFTQNDLFNIETVGVEDGLPNRSVYDMVQDKAGFIWINILGGISRYDGYTFKTYMHSFLNILETSPCRLAVDHANRLWYLEDQNRKGVSANGVIDTRKDTIYAVEAVSGGLFTGGDVLFIKNSRINAHEVLV
ncbi:MAG: hypothetical protein KDD04_09165, partial [Sinomicrobium sp.]|nr:hypothetical protein [Sinomicrobium sp.]